MYDFEVVFAFIIWTGGVFYSIFAVVDAGKYFNSYEDKYGDFKDGWLVIGRKKDAADVEWQTFLRILQGAYPWLLINAIVAECLRLRKQYEVIPWWQFIIGLSFTFYYIGIFGCVIIILQPIFFQAAYKFRRKYLIWISSFICLALITYLKTIEDGTYRILQYNETQNYFLLMTVCWMNLRCLSYYLELVGNKSMKHSIIQALAYSFYLPTLFLGPFISFSSFERSRKCSHEQTLSKRLEVLLLGILRFGTWFMVAEYFLHYVYVNAISYQPQLVHSLSSWALYGYGYSMGQFFHMKYVVLYGISTSLAKFEHILTPPTPKCIGRIHLYSDMWRYFDVGLYKFLVRYIYSPTLFRNSLINKMVSSFLCFLFVYVWHGIQNHILVWIILNFLGITIENAFITACKYYNMDMWLDFKWQRRILCILSSPLLAMTALSNFYFFAGMEIGLIFTERLLREVHFSTLILLFFLTCCGYVSTEVKRWELSSRTQTKKHNL